MFKKLESEIIRYRDKNSSDPQIIFLENHGSFVSADSTEEIRRIYEEIISAIETQFSRTDWTSDDLPYNPVLNKVLPALRMILSDDKHKSDKIQA